MEVLPSHAFLELPNLVVQVADKQHFCFFDAQDLQMGCHTAACTDTMLF